jgi:pyrimidine operon attenuation protein/uracil phosphoribosyltransferase
MSQKYCLLLKVNIILHRLACQLIENTSILKTHFSWIQPRGTFLRAIKEVLENEYNTPEIKLGYLDITFFRDDFHRTDKPLEANKTKLILLSKQESCYFL